MSKTSKEICADLRRYNKDKGWPLAHEAADKIEALEKHLDDIYACLSGMPFDAEEMIGEPRP
jgi:hypothetical protein